MPPDTPRLDFHNAGALKLLDPAPGYRAALLGADAQPALSRRLRQQHGPFTHRHSRDQVVNLS